MNKEALVCTLCTTCFGRGSGPVVRQTTDWWSLEHMVCKIYTGEIIHKIIGAVIHSSFCVFNFMLPTCRPNFAQVGSHHVISLAGPC